MIIQAQQAFTALQTIEDVLVNNIYASNFRMRYAVAYALVASATGLVLDLSVGPNLVTKSLQPSTANRFPLWPDDQNGTFGVVPGDRILLKGVETSNNARTLFFAFKFSPLG